MLLLYHVEDAPWSSAHQVNSHFKFGDVFGNGGSPEAGVGLHVHRTAQGKGDSLGLFGQLAGWRQDENLGNPHTNLNSLEGTQAENCSFART